MKPGWNRTALSAIATIVGRGIAPMYSESGDFIVINQRCIRGGRVKLENARTHDSSLRAVKELKQLVPGDILVNSTGVGTLGRTAPWRGADNLKVTVDSHVTIVRPRRSVHPRWLAYALSIAEPLIESLGRGSTGQTELAANSLAEMQLLYPPLLTQKHIANILGTLDDKIDSNSRIETLIPALIDAIVEREIIDSETSKEPVSSLAKFVNGGAYTKGASGTGRMVIRIADLNSGPGASTVYNNIEVPIDRTANPGDLLMSWSGSLGVYVWNRPQAIVNQHIFKVIPNHYPAWFVHNRLNAVLAEFRAIAADKATTMGHIQRKHLDETSVEIPSKELERMDSLCAPLWESYIRAQRETLQLCALRDTLLPELMSGRMRVDEAGRLVAGVLGEEPMEDAQSH